MRRALTRFFGFALVLTAGCPPTAKPALPSDLPAPEYETPRGYDLGGPKKDAPAPASPPAASAPATSPPAPTTTPAAPPPPPAPKPKG